MGLRHLMPPNRRSAQSGQFRWGANDADGNLIGMNSVIGGLVGETQGGLIGIGFAIPVDQARRITSELIATGSASHAWLGAQDEQ